MRSGKHISLVIPALNEQDAIGVVLRRVPAWVDDIIVVDNGSTDETAKRAKQYGARVVQAPIRGYGNACLKGIASIEHTDVLVFMDGDASDVPEEMHLLVDPVVHEHQDLVIGSRVRELCEAGALGTTQRLGNRFACWLIHWRFGVRFTDLGPFRAIRFSHLKKLGMSNEDYGWTVQMQLRALDQHLRINEVPVSYRRRIGDSKISGTLNGCIDAGRAIIGQILCHPGIAGAKLTSANRRGVPRQAR